MSATSGMRAMKKRAFACSTPFGCSMAGLQSSLPLHELQVKVPDFGFGSLSQTFESAEHPEPLPELTNKANRNKLTRSIARCLISGAIHRLSVFHALESKSRCAQSEEHGGNEVKSIHDERSVEN